MILTHVDYFRIWDVLKDHDVENNALFFAGIGDDLYPIYGLGTRHKGDECAFFLESTACHDCQEKHGASPQLTFADFDTQVTTVTAAELWCNVVNQLVSGANGAQAGNDLAAVMQVAFFSFSNQVLHVRHNFFGLR